MQGKLVSLLVIASIGLGCQGVIGGAGGDEGTPAFGDEPPLVDIHTPWESAESGMRRLTQREYATSVGALLGFEPERAYEFLPGDGREPFDNNSSTQTMSDSLVSGVERLAMNIAGDFVADEVARSAIVPCEPSGPSDTACFRAFVESFTLRAFRRPLADEEVERFVALSAFAEEANDFYFGVETVIMAVLQDPRFLFRLEIGEADASDPQLHHLDQWEIATRLSYLIWGTTPNDWLLEQAAAERLSSPEEIGEVANEMLEDPRALEQALRYHQQWFDYESIGGGPAMAARFRKEANALVERVVGENLAWTELLTHEEAYIDTVLAEHYGVAAPGGEGFAWTDLSETDRGGLLGQGAFLTDEAERTETNPTRRGAEIRARLFCQILAVPADVNVDVLVGDQTAIEANACTPVRLAQHASGGCAGCHALTDPIGYGLEQYDMSGATRDHETDKPECGIEGRGELAGVAQFTGSAELGGLLSGLEEVRSCFVQQLHRFSSGRAQSTPADQSLARALAEQAGADVTYREAIFLLATHASFTERRLQTEAEGARP